MFQTTRRRLALWYTAVTAVLLLLFATGVYLYVRTTLIERIDDTLNHVVEVVERSLVIEPLNAGRAEQGKLRINIEASFRDNTQTLEDDHIDLEWFSPTGDLLWTTLAVAGTSELYPNRAGKTVQLPNGQLLRQVTERIEINRQVLGYLRASHPWFEVTKPSRQLIADLSIGISLMVISVAFIGWLLSGLAIEPVRESYQRLKQFTADASHELRNPIAIIQTNVQVALSDPEIDSQNRQQWQIIERLTRRLGRLVDDLLFLARQDSGNINQTREEVPLDALLMEVIEEQLLSAKEKNVNLHLDIKDPPLLILNKLQIANLPGNAFIVKGDWDQLARLFTNLVNNALQHTPAGGKILIELESTPARNSNNLYLHIKITDTGTGIPSEALPHLFNRFYRADPARSHSSAAGSGLGLAIAGAIVENHHGQIRIESQLKKGTTVSVILPSTKFDETWLNV
ncbi:HAMP domain-containing histidine kinase [Ancylothrix sp. C2]|uniref:sensor histidine kinase n=1 Tax=Ancylothrix sp. D3o TaxID=2953691 RepID=UPI0021BB27FF|nr:HAMP domain-containing histidine kinase [Ancylothrix sp. D3o]MCT7949989.1 HAMP domain-containing histidine kinase [Ancylothrix sp. D3o]